MFLICRHFEYKCVSFVSLVSVHMSLSPYMTRVPSDLWLEKYTQSDCNENGAIKVKKLRNPKCNAMR